MTEPIYSSFDNNGLSYAVLLDISSAYDSVWRYGLRNKMRKKFGLKGRMYWWLDSFLKDQIGQVVLNGINSNERVAMCRIGVMKSTAYDTVNNIVEKVKSFQHNKNPQVKARKFFFLLVKLIFIVIKNFFIVVGFLCGF
ncbi:hypothetical protein RFI_38432 [Reticulomyxa filosa]|uniref:Reverse transcriptase domain-containing protein n=1 Tax=Reticulomyxa filosa TaxID=46433 RepID=X6LCG9_RETFI|nr:hypothetical protein RFI_38432 [Reticulomyxa filosa]|eukprot:ETN99055.1 hypothetical protein RFI_38432 [Reticulomyxa filosa]